ncbi:MAG: hypothetical protein PVH33_16285 [Syntrophobacterales bacterium]|jgi:hypothetical protein
MDLTKPPQKILVVSVAGVMVFLWILVWLFGPKPGKIQESAPIDTMLTSLLQSGKQGKKGEVKPAEEPVPDAWGRDPFALPGWVEEQEKGKTQPVTADRKKRPRKGDKPQYKLSTILVTESSKLAVINDRVYAVGDRIGGEEISKITLDHIVLTDNSEERVLRVPQPQTEVIVEDTEEK